jgi:methyl-accepting chemotaxis protein
VDGDFEGQVVMVLHSFAIVLLQDAGDPGHDMHRGTIFLFVIALALAVQAAGVCVAAAFAIKMFRKIDSMTDSFERKTGPMIERVTRLVDDVAPKLHTITTNVEEISYTVRAKTDEIGATLSQLNETVNDANFRTRVHISHVDGLVSEALATTEEVSRTVQENIKKPVRQIAGIVAGIKAGLETLVSKSPFGKPKGYENPYDL